MHDEILADTECENSVVSKSIQCHVDVDTSLFSLHVCNVPSVHTQKKKNPHGSGFQIRPSNNCKFERVVQTCNPSDISYDKKENVDKLSIEGPLFIKNEGGFRLHSAIRWLK